jgi:uncharacterized protein YkwD
MAKPNRVFRVIVNHIALVIVGAVLVAAGPEGKQANAAPSKPVALDAFTAEMLRLHNEERAFHDRLPLTWDSTLARDAAQWADHLAITNRFDHASKELRAKGQGENLWMGTREAYSWIEMVGAWLAEAEHTKSGRFPDVAASGNWADVGHFTQLIWPETRKLGCAVKSSPSDDYLVCRYWPAGNRIGDNFTIRTRK